MTFTTWTSLTLSPNNRIPFSSGGSHTPATTRSTTTSAGSSLSRVTHPALQRNESQFFYFHPQFDDNNAPRLLGYARTAGNPLGSLGQVIVLANMGPQKFLAYQLPDWPWQSQAIAEIGAMGPLTDPPVYDPHSLTLTLGLDAFQVRVFTT